MARLLLSRSRTPCHHHQRGVWLHERVFGFDVAGPSGSNVVIQASTDLHTWIPLQTNLLGSGPLYFSDPQSTTNIQRFYRAQLSP